MDADRIRQERPHLEVRVENTSYGLQPCILQSNYAFVDMDGGIGTALAEGTYVLVPLADLLDGPTDGAFLVEPEDGFWPTWACDALTELFKERGIYPESGPRRQGFVGAEEVLDRLEAVFQARKEAE